MSVVRVIDAPRRDALGETPMAFLDFLAGPAFLRIPGRDRSRARGLVTLLHGNEPSGLRALHGWLRSGAVPAVDLAVALPGVDAARLAPGFAHRMVPGRPDLNRCFFPPFEGREGAIAAGTLRLLRNAGCECLVDLHNNTGHNPPYGVATRVDTARMSLTALFAERMVHSDLRLGTLVEATGDDFPSMTIECGRAGDPAADAVARTGLERYASVLDPLAMGPGAVSPMQVLEQPIRVCVGPRIQLAFGERPLPGADLTLALDLDRHNFERLPAGSPVGWLADDAPWPIDARGADGVDVSLSWFGRRDGRLVTLRPGIPIMMTTDPVIARADCLFYLARPGTALAGRAATDEEPFGRKT